MPLDQKVLLTSGRAVELSDIRRDDTRPYIKFDSAPVLRTLFNIIADISSVWRLDCTNFVLWYKHLNTTVESKRKVFCQSQSNTEFRRN